MQPSATEQFSQHTMRGMALMLFAMTILPGMDAIAKYMATYGGMSPGQVTFYRFFFQLVCTLPLLVTAMGRDAFRARHPWINLLRGVLHGAASLLFFVAVKYMPLVDVLAIYFVTPFMLTAMSAAFLGERVGMRRWLAIAMGFGGALVVIQPSFAIFGATSLLPLGCAFLFSLYLLLNRAVGEGDSPLTMQTISGFGGMLFMAAAVLIGDAAGVADFAPSLPQSGLALVLLLILGSISGFGHLLVVRAFRMAPLSVLAPIQYFEIVSTTILGYVFFGDFPSASKWVGIAIIVASGLSILRLEQASAARQTRSAD